MDPGANPHGPVVRAARPADLDVLVAAAKGVALESEGLVLDDGKVRAGTQAILEDPGKGRFFVLDEPDAVVAGARRVVASLIVTSEWSDWNDHAYWWIQTAYVVPDRRGQGCLRALYDGVMDAARAAGVGALRLYVEAHNESGLRAYRALGMTQTPYLVFEAKTG